MFFILPILGAATVINCVPFFEDFNDVGSPEDLNVDPSDLTDFSSIPIDEGTKENDETGSDLDEVADVCASSLDNDDAIFRRQICTTKKSGQMVAPQSPEVPHEGVSLHPRFKMDIKSTSDPECVNFDSRPEYVVCGGPEGYTRDDLPLDSTSVFNCISGMTFSGWIPQGGWFKATNKVARYCCSVFTNQWPDYVARVCAKLSPYPDVYRDSGIFLQHWVTNMERKRPYPPRGASPLQRAKHFLNTPLR